MSRNTLSVLVIVLAIGVAVIGTMLYQDRQQSGGVEIKVGKEGMSVEQK